MMHTHTRMKVYDSDAFRNLHLRIYVQNLGWLEQDISSGKAIKVSHVHYHDTFLPLNARINKKEIIFQVIILIMNYSTYVFPTFDPTKPPMPSTSRIKSWSSLFKTQLRNTQPGNRVLSFTETEPFFSFFCSLIVG